MNGSSSTVAEEMKLIFNRLRETEEKQRTVRPVLLAGEQKTAFLEQLHVQVRADFRQ